MAVVEIDFDTDSLKKYLICIALLLDKYHDGAAQGI